MKKTTMALLGLTLMMPGFMKAAEPSFEVYGFAQLDYIQDFNRVQPEWDSTLRPSKIPTTEGMYGSDGQAILSVRQSRIGFKADLPINGESVFTKFEFDFFGVGADAGQTTIRLRHAYGEWGPVLAGQTNSLFMDGDIFPNTIDYWGPTGMVFLRNPQIRLTKKAGDKSFAVALEQPSNDIDDGRLRELDPALDSAVSGDEKYPDLTAQARLGGEKGHVQLAGIVRHLGYETVGGVDSSPKGHKTGWGLDLTSVLKAREGDALRVGVVYGAGIASYMNDGGMDLAPQGSTTTSISAKAVPLIGVSAYYDIKWSDRWSSSVGYSFNDVENTDFQDPGTYARGDYASANLIHYPTQNVFYGLEYLYGRREDANGKAGQDQRVQFSANYKFSSKNSQN